MRRATSWIGLASLCAGFFVRAEPPGPAGDGYRAEVEAWRRQREAELKADDGWLTLVGLHWLKTGTCLVGSDPDCDVVLPASAPNRVGRLTLGIDGAATWTLEPGVAANRAGTPFVGGRVASDAFGPADVIALGDLRLILLARGSRHALRVKDNRSPARAAFSRLRWYPIDPSWRVRARFVPAEKPGRFRVDTIVGEPAEFETPGVVEFERDGKPHRLLAALEDGKLWFVFRDGTTGRTTAPNARQLTAEPASVDGTVILDFNRATNLPCAYTTFATCPLPPRENRLSLAIEAGEMTYRPRSDDAGRHR